MRDSDVIFDLVEALALRAPLLGGDDERLALCYAAKSLIPDRSEVTVIPMTFGRARITIGPPGELGYDDGWCYASVPAALEAFAVWHDPDGEPDGWIRHPGTGRRRPDGDKEREYVHP